MRVADEDDAAAERVLHTRSGGVVDQPLPVHIEGVQAEIAALGVLAPIVAIGDHGPPPVGLHVAPQGGHLIGPSSGDRGDRAMLDPGGDIAEPGRRQGVHHLFGRQDGGDVDVVDRTVDKSVAHTAADEPRAVGPALGLERAEHRPGRWGRHPGRDRQAVRGLHSQAPAIRASSRS